MSHPMWVCGLKPFIFTVCGNVALVTPYVGVWIETTLLCHQEKGSQSSHPMWVCGLKLVELIKRAKRPTVTPYMGVCIETASED